MSRNYRQRGPEQSIDRRSVLKGIGALTAGAVAGSSLTGSGAAAIGDSAVYQYYHTDWNTVRNDLSAVADAGYDAIQVPPAQFSRLYEYEREYDSEVYHQPLGYQPIDFRDFDSVFGTESEYQAMVDEAHDQGLDVIADAVMNHLAAGGDNFDRHVSMDDIPRFSENDLHEECEIDYSDEDSVENCWLVGLRDLAQESSYVRGELYNYLEKYANLGVDGVRFDAAKHMPEWFFSDYANQWADDLGLYRVGEVLDGSTSSNQGYADTGMSVTDFSLYFTMRDDVFHSSGDMNALDGAGLVNQDPMNAMTFVSNHDMEPPEYEKLAYAYILTYEGYPRVYNHRIGTGDSDISNLLWIRRNVLGGRAITRYVDGDFYVFEREDSALVALNTGSSQRGEWVDAPWTNEVLEDYTGNQGDAEANSDGWAYVTAPATGWAVYAPEGQGDGGSGGGGDSLEGTYALLADHSGKALDVDGGTSATHDGADVHQWEYLGNANQHWEITANGDGTYRLVAQHSSKVAAVDGGSTDDGASVVQWEWTGADDQRWEITENDDGTYRVINAKSGKAMDVSDISTDNGATVHQWDYGGGDNQHWRLDPV